MKKLIGILIMIILTLNVFGQTSLRGRVVSRNFIASLQYKFTVDDITYAIGYDTSPYDYYSPHLKRDVYLYRNVGNGWEIASNVIRSDFRITDILHSEDNYGTKVTYYESFWENHETNNDSDDRKNFEHSSIKLVNNIIEIKMLIFYGQDTNERHDDLYQHRWEYYTLIPIGNGMFNLKQ